MEWKRFAYLLKKSDEENEQLKQDALMFEALEAAYKSDEVEVFMFDGTFMVKYNDFDDSDHLDTWYKRQIEKGE